MAGCIAAAVVLVMALQSGAVVHQQITRSVRIDSEVHEEGMDIAGAARKLDGMLVAGLVRTIPYCLATNLFSNREPCFAKVAPRCKLCIYGICPAKPWLTVEEQGHRHD